MSRDERAGRRHNAMASQKPGLTVYFTRAAVAEMRELAAGNSRGSEFARRFVASLGVADERTGMEAIRLEKGYFEDAFGSLSFSAETTWPEGAARPTSVADSAYFKCGMVVRVDELDGETVWQNWDYRVDGSPVDNRPY